MGIQPEKEREEEGERERETRVSQISKKLVRETSLRNWSILYCSEGFLYFLIVHRDQLVIQNYAVSAALTHRDQAFLCILSCIHKS